MASLVENGNFSLTLFPLEDSTSAEATFLKAPTELVLKLLNPIFKGNNTLLFEIGSSRLDTAMNNAGRNDGPFTSVGTLGSSKERLLLDSWVKERGETCFLQHLSIAQGGSLKVDQQLNDRGVSRISWPPPGFFNMVSNRSKGETVEEL